MKNIVIALTIIGSLLIANNNYGAVTSVGEINVVGQTRGVVPANSTVPLIVTLSIDRSLAEPGEEIKTIEIAMPSGFLTQSSYFKGILRDRNEIPARPVVSGGNVLRVELADAIVDFQNSIYEIIFECRTPNTITLKAVFRARLRNRDDAPIGEFIREGQADSKLNNDDFNLEVIQNVPPDPVIGFAAEADGTGENDATLRWQKSGDPDVNGYLIYRNNENTVTEDDTINVENRSSTTFRDVNVPPGSYTYQIVAYKTIFLQSERSSKQTVVVSPDTAAPEPPIMLSITPSSDGIEIFWKPSSSRDVTTYRITEGSTILAEINESKTEYKFIDDRPLPTGSFIYAVIAIDEENNESIPLEKRLRILDEPYPNPFTPLSPDEDFNQVVFPARALEEASGEFTVLIFDIDGMLVRSLTASPGETELIWDGRNEAGEIVESGVYVYQLQVGESFKTGTLIAAK